MIKQEFNIKENSRLPLLVMRVTDENYFTYEDFHLAISEAVITFSMKEVGSNKFKITKKKCNLLVKEPNCADCTEERPEYYIYYQFSKRDTNKVGRYKGEFHIEFSNNQTIFNTNLILPVSNDLYVNVIPSIF